MKPEVYNADISKLELPVISNNAFIDVDFDAQLSHKNFDFSKYFNTNPEETLFMVAKGYSMMDSGISDGDILVVDKSRELTNNQLVIATMNSELTVKRICKHEGKLYLIPDNADYKRIEITSSMDFKVWGVVTFVIHKF